MADKIVQQGQPVTIIFALYDFAGNLVSGQAANVGKALRDEDGAAGETVTVTEQGASGFYEAAFTPTKGSVNGFQYLLKLNSPAGTNLAIYQYELASYPSVAYAGVTGTFLTTLAAVKEYLGNVPSTDDTLITNLIARGTRMLHAVFDRYVPLATYSEVRDGNGRPRLHTLQWPIVTMTALYLSSDQVWDSTTLVAAADYLVDKPDGRLYLKSGLFLEGFQNVRVDYDGGYATIPADVEWLAVQAVSRMYKRRKSIDVLSMSLKDGSVTKHVATDLFKDFLVDVSPWVNRRVA